MDFLILFWFIVIILAIALTFALIKGILKAIILSITILSVFLAVFGFFVVTDFIDLKENFMGSQKLVVLKEKDQVLAAFTFVNISDGLSSITALKDEDIQNISENIRKGKLSAYKETYYKIIMVETVAFNESLSNGISYDFGNQELDLTKEETISILKSESPIDALLAKMEETNVMGLKDLSDAEKQFVKNEFIRQLNIESQEQFKSYLFMMLAMDMVQDKGSLYAVVKLKQKQINIYPNTAVFRAIRMVPMSMIEKIGSKIATVTD